MHEPTELPPPPPDDPPRKVQVHRIELVVIDHDDLGTNGCKEVLELTRYPNHCMNPQVRAIETREVEWTDEHPLNYTGAKFEKAYRELFDLESLKAPEERTKLIMVADRWGYDKVLQGECPCCGVRPGQPCDGTDGPPMVHESRSDAAYAREV